ncbi:two-component sensor histidine kinase [Staphylococcus haemolyticus]|uniref:Sensor protein SrrB n=5 Tax=Staphylococcus haemolyticus TaxID=1283 RepID=A0AB38PF50_STAHA|nr:ATP-binding protein [Staphylococcus haemolyticus]MWF63217.1 HAMP domain-containing protein [Staphylococcus haemolyticus]PTK41716.1 two-component sensor histidine kinase [Staphylococcus haemolyticus]PTK54260.1 two-component sensor histidine kinase [Staphylococcus haemolyticus]PTK61831.1 two-component sensor histidine kinase [Staphylococcus haemolyticus]PTK71965.1 two-component sensor histidine kinase [Staphylococcus haemolyticus]
MTNRLNSVVIKLWLTILFIVTTVLILLSAALITFIQYYYTQQTENAIREDASRISHLVEQADNKTLAIEHSQQLIDGSGGVIIMANKSSSIKSSNSNTKDKMLEEIHKNSQFQRVFSQGKSTTQNITISNNGNSHSYILLGYPMKAQENANSKYSAVFIYQDLKSIEDTNNAITIIILITAIIFIAVSTIFAFFLSNRITKPLRQLRTQAINISKGDYSKQTSVSTKDEIGELSHTFNNMSSEIQENIEALSTQKNIRDSLINSMIEGVLGLNDKREVILSNKMADDIIKSIDKTVYKEIEKQIETTFVSKDTEFQEYEINNKYYVIIMSYVERIQQDGRSGIVVIIRDMTNEHNLDQMKKDFIANVSHELRTPISLLQGYTESIVDGIVTEPEEIRDSLSIVLDETKRLNRLVNELLNVARMDAEGLTVNKEKQPIKPLLSKMQMKYRQQAEDLELNMSLEPNIGDELWEYDADRIDQVLTNLIDNATRYTQPGDSISITTTTDDSYQTLYIKDTGSGISPEHLELVFDRFYKVEASRTRGKQGTGLGLFICKMIIEEHGGTIKVESEVNKGTTFIIKLPKPKN